MKPKQFSHKPLLYDVADLKREVDHVLTQFDQTLLYGIMDNAWTVDPTDDPRVQDKARKARAALCGLALAYLETNGHKIKTKGGAK